MRSWCAARPDAMSWRKWDDEVVVYNELTGSTHHLSAVGSVVFLTLPRHPPGIEMAALVRDVSSHLAIAENPLLMRQVERALAELAELKLAAGSSA